MKPDRTLEHQEPRATAVRRVRWRREDNLYLLLQGLRTRPGTVTVTVMVDLFEPSSLRLRVSGSRSGSQSGSHRQCDFKDIYNSQCQVQFIRSLMTYRDAACTSMYVWRMPSCFDLHPNPQASTAPYTHTHTHMHSDVCMASCHHVSTYIPIPRPQQHYTYIHMHVHVYMAHAIMF